MGFSITQEDGLEHDLDGIAYYTNLVTIPTHVPDGEYILGWTWYGGTVGGTEVANTNTAPPGERSSFGTYWACSYIAICMFL